MHTTTMKTSAAAAAAACLVATWAGPVQATRTDHGSGRVGRSGELDVALLVAHRKTQMAHDLVALALARHAAREPRGMARPEPGGDNLQPPSCARFPDLCHGPSLSASAN